MLELDSGSSQALMLRSPFVAAHQLATRIATGDEVVLGQGVGGALRGRAGRVPMLELGGHALHDVPTALATGAGGSFASSDLDANIGGEILRRFRVYVDCPRSTVFLVPGLQPPR